MPKSLQIPAPPKAPVPAQPEAPLSKQYTLMFKGVVRIYTFGMPEDSIVNLSDSGFFPTYVTCWIDGERGKSAHVSFADRNSPGTFELELDFRDGDPDRLKLELCMRMQDPESHNRRSAELCTSYALMRPMLAGENDAFEVPNTFVNGNSVQICMCIKNATDFRNHPKSASDTSKPLLTLVESKLGLIETFNAQVNMISAQINTNNGQNHTKMPPGGDAFKDGITRY
jgi:hypothetical protein